MSANRSLRRLPRWVWVVGGLALIGLPLLALALGAAALFGLWQWGSAAVESGRTELAERVPALAAPLESLGAASLDEAAQAARALTEDAKARLAEGQAALAVDPGYTPIFIDLAEAARQAGLQGKAITYYREALERDPGNFAAISGEGAALVEKGAVEKARRNLAKLQSLCGDACPETVALQRTIARGPSARLAVDTKAEGAAVSN